MWELIYSGRATCSSHEHLQPDCCTPLSHYHNWTLSKKAWLPCLPRRGNHWCGLKTIMAFTINAQLLCDVQNCPEENYCWCLKTMPFKAVSLKKTTIPIVNCINKSNCHPCLEEKTIDPQRPWHSRLFLWRKMTRILTIHCSNLREIAHVIWTCT
jgi:hypothetical protein